jgi:catechol 2,3-dioxygenase-like lactoylglutathione lyase family enzyme
VDFALDHIGMLTEDSAAVRFLQDVGFSPAAAGDVDGFRCHCAFLQQGGVTVEVVRPWEGPGVLRDALEAHGPGLHHIAFRVPDLMAAVRAWMSAGVRFRSRIERGAKPGMYVTFCDPASTGGLLIELVEYRKEAGEA